MALTDAKNRAAKPDEKSYKIADSGNMFMLVHPNGSKYWRLRYRFLGKEKTLALGLYPDVSLSEAREKRDEARKLIAEGIDPCEQKRVKKSVPDCAQTFEAVARQWHSSNKKWSESHSDKTLKSLETHVFPFIGSRDITTLRTPDLLVPVKAAEAKEIYEVFSNILPPLCDMPLSVALSAITRLLIWLGLSQRLNDSTALLLSLIAYLNFLSVWMPTKDNPLPVLQQSSPY